MSEQLTNPVNPSDKRRWIGYAQSGLIVFAIAVALFLARAPERTEFGPTVASGNEDPVVQVVMPAPVAYVHQLDLTGTVSLSRKVKLLSEVEGRVIWVSPDFKNGSNVPAGEVFARVDPRKYEIEVNAAEMAVAKAQARLQLAKRLDGPDAGLLISDAEAVLGQAEAALALARLRLERTEVKLSFDARVMATDLEVGDLVGPPETTGERPVLGVVFRPAAIQLQVPISSDDLASLAPPIGRSAHVRTVDGTYDAELVRVSSAVAPESRLARAYFEFSEDVPLDELPVPGTFAEVTIFGPEREDVFVLPEAAARENDSIWIVQEGVLQGLKPETVGRSADGWIVEAFDSADGVVVSVLASAKEGLKVVPEHAPSGQ